MFRCWYNRNSSFRVVCPINVLPHPESIMPKPGDDTSRASETTIASFTDCCSTKAAPLAVEDRSDAADADPFPFPFGCVHSLAQ